MFVFVNELEPLSSYEQTIYWIDTKGDILGDYVFSMLIGQQPD